MRKLTLNRLTATTSSGGGIAGLVVGAYANNIGLSIIVPKKYRPMVKAVVLLSGCGIGSVTGYVIGDQAKDFIKELPFIGKILTGEKSTAEKTIDNVIGSTISGGQHILNVVIPPATNSTHAASTAFPSPYNLGMPFDLTEARKWAIGRVNYGLQKGWYSSKDLPQRILSFSLQQVKDIRW